jgi:MarR family transcriptional regulator for hemolysin
VKECYEWVDKKYKWRNYVVDISTFAIFVYMEKLESIFFYHLEKAIKSYRQFAQNRLVENGQFVTIDQWLVLKVLKDNPGIAQVALAEKVFKDKASVTRIIDILVKNKHLKRSPHEQDQKRSKLTITKKGEKIIKAIMPTVSQNRKTALKGLTKKEIQIAEKVLLKITANCER